MREKFINKNFTTKTELTIRRADAIISEYKAQGLQLTLRQLYYQFVSRDMIANKQAQYNQLGTIISNARLAGRLDWDAIEDRGRNLVGGGGFDNTPQDALNDAADYYCRDWWRKQTHHVEVWIEKEALAGVISSVCHNFRVPYIACKGYMSQSEMYAAGKRIDEAIKDDKEVVIIHLGDHDPSGIDMTRDITDRLKLFGIKNDCDFCGVTAGIDLEQAEKQAEKDGCEYTAPCQECFEFRDRLEYDALPLEVRRIALNMDQVEQYGPPPNPAKTTDCRFESYADEYGDESWELDALEPSVMSELIEDEINGLIDFDAWGAERQRERDEKATLISVGENFEKIKDMIKDMETDDEQ